MFRDLFLLIRCKIIDFYFVDSLSGDGTLTLNLSWPTIDVLVPIVDATLTPTLGSPIPLIFDTTTVPGTASITNLAIPAGYYILNITLLDNGTEEWKMVPEAVRIIEGDNTSAILTAASTGNVSLSISSDLQNPIILSLDGNPGTLNLGEDMTITVNSSLTPDSYLWYLNSSIISGETSSTIVIGSGLTAGNYSLASIVQKGSILSSAYILFTVVQP